MIGKLILITYYMSLKLNNEEKNCNTIYPYNHNYLDPKNATTYLLIFFFFFLSSVHVYLVLTFDVFIIKNLIISFSFFRSISSSFKENTRTFES